MTFSKNKINSFIKIIIACTLMMLLSLYLGNNYLNAQSAVVDLRTQTEKNSDSVTIEVYGRTPVYLSGYSIRINYNNKAFEYLGTEFVDFSGLNTNAKIVESSILEISAQNGSIPYDENLLAKIKLRAIDPGVATILIINSSFYDSSGNKIPGTMLKYYQVDTNYTHPNNNSGNNDSTVQSEENLGTVGTTSKIDLDSTNNPTSKGRSTNKSKNSDQTSDNKIKESTLDVEVPNESNKTNTDYTNIFKPIIIATIIILFTLLLIFIVKKLFNKKRKD